MKAALFVALSLALVAVACAAPSAFIGGSFYQAAGQSLAGHFGAFNVGTNKWSSKLMAPPGTINSLAAAGNGTFAVGTWDTVSGSASKGVAYWDGTKWCPIRQGLEGSGRSVVCDSATSCYVAGAFDTIQNVVTPLSPSKNFVRYVFNSGSAEWEADLSSFTWNNATETAFVLPADTDIDKLRFVGSGSNLFFFASVATTNTIFRGSAADNGWFVFATDGSITGAGAINDWSIDPAGSNMYVVSDAFPDSLVVNTALTAACGTLPCTTTTANWTPVIAAPGVNVTLFTAPFSHVFATATARLLTGRYDPDGPNAAFVGRDRVFTQTGTGIPTLVGDAFDVAAATGLFSRILATENGDALVVGSFSAGNLFYPTDPTTDDVDGVVGDRRPLDRLSGMAVFNATVNRWVQWGAGGVSPLPATPRLTFNSNTREWFFYDATSTQAFNLHADGALFHDDDSALTDPFFPIFTRALGYRGGTFGEVWEILCETRDCSSAFVAGDYTFHGVDTLGAIARAVVKRSGDPELTTVGGGLWKSSEDFYLDDEEFQLDNGQVYSLALVNGFLYAGGTFSRTAPGSGFVCLNNIARIDASTLTGNWETLGGGCDSDVYDIVEYNGKLHVAGQFEKCGDAIVNYVAAYTFGDETPAWEPLNAGVDATAYSLELFQGRLIVGGTFGYAGGLPVSGVASWDGSKWRALLPACTDDCVAGDLQYYFNVLNSPSAVHHLQRDRSGRYLFASGDYSAAPAGRYLSRWEYTDGDFGQWLVKGQLDFAPDFDGRGEGVAIFTNGQLLVAGDQTTYLSAANANLGVWDQDTENTNLTPSLIGNDVWVVRGPDGGNAGSASSLSSPLAALVAFVF